MLQEIIDNFQYKPGYRFTIVDGSRILLVHSTKDINTNDPCMVTTSTSLLHRECTELEIVDVLRFLILDLERHEALEHMKYKNERIFDPHKN